MNSDKSNIIVGSILTVLGFLGCLMLVKKPLRKLNKNSTASEATDKIENVNEIAIRDAAEEFSYRIMTEMWGNFYYNECSPSDFFKDFIKFYIMSMPNKEFSKYIPKDIIELDSIYKKRTDYSIIDFWKRMEKAKNEEKDRA